MLGVVCVALLCALGAARGAEYHSVCVVGGGSSGTASAVFLKDRGYTDVLVLERAAQLGGHCNDVPTPGQGVGYIAAGVQEYVNTSHYPGFNLTALEYVLRWLPPADIIPLDFSHGDFGAEYLVDLALGGIQPPPVGSQTALAEEEAIGASLGRLIGFVSQYPWLNTAEIPDPIPAPLLQPFLVTVAELNLWPLAIPVFASLLSGQGVGPLSNLTTLEAVLTADQMVLSILTGPGSAFAVGSGCQSMYDVIAATYLAGHVVYNVSIDAIIRPSTCGAESPVRIHASVNNGATHNEYHCGALIMAIGYPTLENLQMLQLTEEEESLFGQFSTRPYMDAAFEFTEGATIAGKPFTIFNVNLTSPTLETNLPSMSVATRSVPTGGAAAWANGVNPTDQATMLAALEAGLAEVPAQFFTNARVIFSSLHQYSGHFSVPALSASPNAYTRVTALQGTRGTYWVGAGITKDSSAVIWNHAFNLLQKHFPLHSADADK